LPQAASRQPDARRAAPAAVKREIKRTRDSFEKRIRPLRVEFSPLGEIVRILLQAVAQRGNNAGGDVGAAAQLDIVLC
ncbi:hypothetical protein C1882_28735, partial [Pseudomonas sp. FW305-E2]